MTEKFVAPLPEQMRETYTHALSHCWSCGGAMDTCCGPNAPEPGHIACCLACAAPSEFDAKLQLVRPTDTRLAFVLTDAEVRAFQATIQTANLRARRQQEGDFSTEGP